jgi:hypothetical protein
MTGFSYDSYNGWYIPAGGAAGEAACVAAGQYMDIQLSAASGYALNMSQLEIWAAADTVTGGKVYVYVNGSSLATRDVPAGTTVWAQPTTGIPSGVQVDLSAFQGVSSLDVKVYFDSSAVRMSLGALQLDGEAAPIPEPATLALLAMGGIGMLVRRKR